MRSFQGEFSSVKVGNIRTSFFERKKFHPTKYCSMAVIRAAIALVIDSKDLKRIGRISKTNLAF